MRLFFRCWWHNVRHWRVSGWLSRESSLAVDVGGVRTNFRMPDIVSIGVGGGSLVREQPDGSVTVGPDSVGYRITQEALVLAAHN